MLNFQTSSLGRYIYALANIAFGIFTFIWQDNNSLNIAHGHHAIVLLTAALEVLGGLAILFPRTVRFGTLTLAVLYIAIGLTAIPFILKNPRVYANWGEFFYQLALAVGAIILFAVAANKPTIARIGIVAFALCNLSFAAEQYEFLAGTASLVPHWIPLSGTFWAWATTVFFLLAAVGLLTGILARLAAQLDTAMLILFALLSLLPVVIANHHSFFRSTELVETVLTAASAWVIADYLASAPLMRKNRGHQ
jgi:uncharacterized membrane protein